MVCKALQQTPIITLRCTPLEQLDNAISKWNLVWEIGPGLIKENSFTISPNGNITLSAFANYIIKSAPTLDNWEFYSWKQPKENWYAAKLSNSNSEVNAIDWTYVLLQYPDDKFEILIKADNLKPFATGTKELAVDLVLTNLLGEKKKMEELVLIDIVDEFDNKEGGTKLLFLPLHIEALKKGE